MASKPTRKPGARRSATRKRAAAPAAKPTRQKPEAGERGNRITLAHNWTAGPVVQNEGRWPTATVGEAVGQLLRNAAPEPA